MEFIKKRIGQQTIGGIICICSFPFLYFGGIQEIRGLMLLGLAMLNIGMIPALIIAVRGKKK